MTSAPFALLPPRSSYPPLEDLGLIGDGAGAALVCRDGSIPWMCVPRFDSPPIFAALLDHARGGAFRIDLAGAREGRQEYVPDTGVLITEVRGDAGRIRITDLMALNRGADLDENALASRRELVRIVEAVDGRPQLTISIAPFGRAGPVASDGDLEWDPGSGAGALALRASAPLAGPETRLTLSRGHELHMVLGWGSRAGRRHLRRPVAELRDQTEATWRRWARSIDYEGPAETLVRRSALTLKMLDHFENGGIVAAPTSSLPEAIGGPRNWDYRYTWIRDAAFSVYALHRIGLKAESHSFLGWVLDAVGRDGHPKVLYDLDGGRPAAEVEDPLLEGYRGSAPVRWGNGAADQRQHDVYGEIIDCAWQWHRQGGSVPPALWRRLRGLIDAAAEAWRTPDHGIWEIRSEGRVFTYSAALCHVALDRGVRIAEAEGLPGDAGRWRREADRIRRAILEESWDPEMGSLTEHVGDGGSLDASLLALPLHRPAGRSPAHGRDDRGDRRAPRRRRGPAVPLPARRVARRPRGS